MIYIVHQPDCNQIAIHADRLTIEAAASRMSTTSGETNYC